MGISIVSYYFLSLVPWYQVILNPFPCLSFAQYYLWCLHFIFLNHALCQHFLHHSKKGTDNFNLCSFLSLYFGPTTLVCLCKSKLCWKWYRYCKSCRHVHINLLLELLFFLPSEFRSLHRPKENSQAVPLIIQMQQCAVF